MTNIETKFITDHFRDGQVASEPAFAIILKGATIQSANNRQIN
ncbi:MAG: hypothetical protein ABJB21_08245 [bacterium]